MRRLSSKLKKALNGQKKSERRPIAWEEEPTEAAPDTPLMPAEDSAVGLVVSISRRSCRLFFEGELIDCLLPKSIAREQQSRLAVGDLLRFEKRADRNVVLEVLPRRTLLSRPDPHDPAIERAIAANVDQVVQVVSVKSPPLHPRLIDRYMIAAQRGEAAYVLCVNKVDLLEEGERDLPELQPYRELGVPVILCSTKQRQGLDELRAILEGKTSVLVGHSGVGKSSLLNALEPELRLATKEVSESSGTGRHATTSSTLFRFDAATWVIDTPGIRELGLVDLTTETLVWYFPEFEPYVVHCYFRDCSHSHEPSCAVRDAAAKGEIIRQRYETYLRLMEELRGG